MFELVLNSKGLGVKTLFNIALYGLHSIYFLGPDGTPTAVDHVLELVENHASQIKGLQPQESSDSDND